MMEFEQSDHVIMQINIENGGDFKHIIQPLSNMERLALTQYLKLVQEQILDGLDFEFGDID